MPDLKCNLGLKNLLFANKEIHDLLLSIEKQGEDVSMVLDDSSDIYSFELLAKVINEEFLKINTGLFEIKGDGKIDIRGDIPITRDRKVDVNVKGQGLELDALNAYLKIKEGFFSNINFDLNLNGTLNSLLIFLDFEIFGEELKGKGTLKYGNKVLSLEKFLLNEFLVALGAYDLDVKDSSFTCFFNDMNSNFILDIITKFEKIKNNKYIKKIEKIKARLENFIINGQVKSSRQNKEWQIRGLLKGIDVKKKNKWDLALSLADNIFKVDKFSIMQDNLEKASLSSEVRLGAKQVSFIKINSFLDDYIIDGNKYYGILNINIAENSENNLRGQVSINNFGVNDLRFFKLSLNVKYFKKILYLQNLYFDNILDGQAKIDFANNKAIKGFYVLDFDRLKDLLLITGMKLKFDEIKTKAKVYLTGTLKKPEVRFEDVFFEFLKNKKKYTIKTKGIYKKRNFSLLDGSIYINQKKKLNFYGDMFSTTDFRFSCNLFNLDSKEIDELVDTKKIVEGRLNGRLFFKVKKHKIFSNLDLNIKNGGFLTFICNKLKGSFKINLKKRTLNFIDFLLETSDARRLVVQKNSFVKFRKKKNFSYDLNFYLKRWNLLGLFNGLGSLRIKGECRNNIFDFSVHADNFWANKYNLRNKKLNLMYKNKSLAFSPDETGIGLNGFLHFKKDGIKFTNLGYVNPKKGGSLVVNGMLYKNKNIDLIAEGYNFPIEIISGIVHLGVPISGDSDFIVTIKKSLVDPLIVIDAKLKNGSYGPLKYDNSNAFISIKKDQVLIKNLTIDSINKYKISVDGVIPYPLIPETKPDVMKKNMLLRIKSYDSNLKILESFLGSDIIKPKGKVQIDLKIKNNIFDPVFEGYIKVSKGSFSLTEGLKNVKNLNADFVFKQNQMTINKFDCKVGSGLLNISGGLKLKKFAVDLFNIVIKTDDNKGIPIFLNYLKVPQSAFLKIMPSVPSKGNMRGRINLAGKPDDYMLNGKLYLTDANFTYPPQPSEDGGVSSFGYFLQKAKWGLQLEAESNTWFENEFVNLAIEGFFDFRGPGEKMIVNGEINFLRGDITYVGTSFKVLEGMFSVIDNEPYIQLTAETVVQREDSLLKTTIEDTIVLYVERNKLSEIKPRFESRNYPDTDSREAMGLAFSGGVSDEMSAEEKEVYLRREAFKLVDSTLTTPLIKMLVRRTGLVDFVKVKTSVVQKGLEPKDEDEQVDAKELLTGSSLVVGKQVHRDLFVSYSLGVDEREAQTEEKELELQHEIEAKYRLKRNLYLKGLLGIDKASRRDDK
ncbi:translocation/assembly module TamB domain-containing protein, partial [bacterium]